MMRLLGFLLSLAVLVGLAMVSLMLLPIVLLTMATVVGWFWWKTRHLRRELQRQARARPPHPSADDHGDVIEGEAVVIEPDRPAISRPASADLRDS